MSGPEKPRALPGRRRAAGGGSATSVAEAFGAAPSWASAARLRELPRDAIRPNPNQPRKRFDEDALQRLAASIRERGLLQPVLVRALSDGDHYELVAGERRWRAAAMVALDVLPAFIRDDTDDASALELALIENAAREDLTPVEEARTLSALIDDLGVTQSALARRICRSRSDLANTLRLLDLPDEVLDLLDAGQLTKGHGKSLLREPEDECRIEFARRAVAGGWSVRQLERAITSTEGAETDSIEHDAARSEAAELLAEGLRRCVGGTVKVRPRGGGFAIQLLVASLEDVESIVARLAEPT
jgi:ParB family transcriptional regulator, chromosome partitioning protein